MTSFESSTIMSSPEPIDDNEISVCAPTVQPTKPNPLPQPAVKGKVWGKPASNAKKTFSDIIQDKVDWAGPQQVCGNALHWKRTVSLDSAPVIERCSNREVLAMMMPGDKAKCSCQRTAMQALWYKQGQGNQQPTGCWSSRYVADGTYTMGVGNLEMPRIIFRLPFALNKDQFTFLCSRFPQFYFVCGTAYHDHPVAHASTMVATWLMWEEIGSSRRVLDLHGSPKSNATRENVETVVEMCVPRDAVRKVTKWGNSEGYKEHAMRDITTCPSPEVARWMETFDQFVSVHTGYYYQMEELTALLQHKPGSTLTMLMHRFNGETGTLNDGEQRWAKRDATSSLTEVVQTNVLTGEQYVHPDNSIWFSSHSWAPKPVEAEEAMVFPPGIAWTTNMVGPEIYKITVTSCEGRIVANDPGSVCAAIPVAPPAGGDLGQIQRAGACSVEIGGQTVTLQIDAPVTYSAARTLVAGKPRGPKRFADHLAATKRLAKSNAESTMHIQDVALASYFADFERDRALSTGLFDGGYESMREFELCMGGKSLKQYRTLFGKAIGLATVVLSHSKSPPEKMATAVLSHIGMEIAAS